MVAISFDRFAAVVFPLRHKNLIGKCGLKAMLAVSWTIPIPPHFKAYCSTGSLSRQIYWTGNFCLHLLLYFFFLLFDCGVSATPQENKKAARYPNSFCETDYGREVRAACRIAIGVFTACWVPLMIVLFFTGKLQIKRSSPLHMWLCTLALSNSAMNFLIYSAKIRHFKDAYIGILRKMLRLRESAWLSLYRLRMWQMYWKVELPITTSSEENFYDTLFFSVSETWSLPLALYTNTKLLTYWLRSHVHATGSTRNCNLAQNWHEAGAPNDLLSVKNIGMRKYKSPTAIKNANEKLD